ncbi:MAG: hypothetical protein AB1432_10955 [Bacteroidota bacterium]
MAGLLAILPKLLNEKLGSSNSVDFVDYENKVIKISPNIILKSVPEIRFCFKAYNGF